MSTVAQVEKFKAGKAYRFDKAKFLKDPKAKAKVEAGACSWHDIANGMAVIKIDEVRLDDTETVQVGTLNNGMKVVPEWCVEVNY